jgi:hypothetical protein
MKLELLTHATVGDAIWFVASHAAPRTIEKANSEDRVTVDEESSDIQGSEENRICEQQSTTRANNSIF